MRGKARDSERAWRKLSGELGVERLCDRWFDLVLDGNVQARTGLILRDQQAAKLVREFIANVQQFRAVDTVCDALAQQHNLAQLRDGRRTFGRQRRQPRFDFGQMARRQVMEQGDMGVELIALGREVGAAQTIRPSLIGFAHFGGDDDGGGQSTMNREAPSSVRERCAGEPKSETW